MNGAKLAVNEMLGPANRRWKGRRYDWCRSGVEAEAGASWWQVADYWTRYDGQQS